MSCHSLVRSLIIAGTALIVLTVAGCAAVDAAPRESAKPTASALSGSFAGVDAYHQIAEMGRGVNVLSEDPGWTDPSLARFKPALFKKIRAAGFSTVRVVANPFGHMDAYYVVQASWFQYLDTMLQSALDAGLTVILDAHEFEYCAKDVLSCQSKLNAFWAQASVRYHNAPAKLIFEILNEPNGAVTPELWNAQIRQTLPIIRASNPVRNVVIGPPFWNSIVSLPKLELPVTDRHLIVTFHYYEPGEFTHQGAPWATRFKLTGQNWGSAADIEKLNRDFDTVKTWSETWNRPILLGEFGSFEAAPMDGRQRYDSAVARAAEARGFAWCYWQFDKDFIVYDIAKDEWVEPILNALIPKN